MFDFQPTLKGELLELRPMTAADFDALYAVARDPLIWEQHPARERYKEDQFRIFFDEGLQLGGALVAVDAKTGQLIGSSRYRGYSESESEVEIGWSFLAREYWGGMYNREMKRLMLEHAFTFVRTVVFLIGLKNIRSQMAVEKIGGVRVANRIDSRGVEGAVYAITRS